MNAIILVYFAPFFGPINYHCFKGLLTFRFYLVLFIFLSIKIFRVASLKVLRILFLVDIEGLALMILECLDYLNWDFGGHPILCLELIFVSAFNICGENSCICYILIWLSLSLLWC
jgi:hypothetical protein